MIPDYISHDFLLHFIKAALQEDVGDGDHSSLACIPAEAINKAALKIKDNGILAGVEVAKKIVEIVDPTLALTILKPDGSVVKKGEIGFTVEGPSRAILVAERLVLNCMQRMSGIATKTNHLVSLIEGTNAVLLDTRKTTPNFRLLEKWAVVIGGGKNHRMGLYDMVMLKDNHIDMAGGIEQAIIRTKDYLRTHKKNLKIEIEARSIGDVKQILEVGGIDIIMLDNMSPAEMKTCVGVIANQYKTEASGGISESTIREIAQCGVDFISVGELTHSVKSMDLSLKVI